jgi:hypothetical protein
MPCFNPDGTGTGAVVNNSRALYYPFGEGEVRTFSENMAEAKRKAIEMRDAIEGVRYYD